MIGNKRGGISLYYGSLDSTVSNNINEINTTKYTLFPNPSSKKINSNVPLNTSYQIYSIDGGLIQQGLFSMEIDIEGLENGIYFILFHIDNDYHMYKFVKCKLQ